MSFGRNPHVAKAEAAEQKATCAKDELAREQAWREAARFWERASERETDGKRRQQYLDKAEGARVNAERPVVDALADTLVDASAEAPPDAHTQPTSRAKPKALN